MTANMVLVLAFDAGTRIGADRLVSVDCGRCGRQSACTRSRITEAPDPISPSRSRPLKTQVGPRRLAGDAYGGRRPNCQENGPFGLYDRSCVASAANISICPYRSTWAI